MDADTLIDSMRGVLLVVLRDGSIAQARGGFGGFFGVDVDALPGTNVFDHVQATDAEELAMYFIDSVGESAETIALPLPFRMSMLDASGFAHPVDVIPTGKMTGPADWSWTVLVIPVALNGSISRSLDLEMAGAPREIVRSMLCEELRVDNANYTSRWLLIDLTDPDRPEVLVARADDHFISTAVARSLDEQQWRPWADVQRGTLRSLDVGELPAPLRSLMDANGWNRSIVAPVHVRDRLVAVFLLVGAVPRNYDPMDVKRNVAARIQTLVRATAMLIGRWGDQDRLEVAASTDELTGLLNRRELFVRLANERRSGSVLYIDVDDFKSINDRFGHAAGDQVLVELARRIESACRSHDSIGRVGGDEFVVVLPGADVDLAHDIALRIIERVAAPLVLESGPLDLSVSVGHALLDSDDAIDAADHAMLDAKRTGQPLATAADTA